MLPSVCVSGHDFIYLKTQNAERRHDLVREFQVTITTTQNCVFIWKIPNVVRRRREAAEERVTYIYSPPFYTGHHGYKMCISVYPNGTSEGLGTYVSVFVHFMVGEYDDWLDWPFQGQIIILFLSQQSLLSHLWDGRRGHQHQVVCLDDLKSLNYRTRVTNGTYSLGWGTEQGLSHLKLGNFLQNDCLKVRVHAVLFLPL